MPWKDYEPLVHGSVVYLKNITGFPAAVLVNPKYYSGLETPEYHDFLNGGHVNMLWAVPVTPQECEYIKTRSSLRLLKKPFDINTIHIFTGEPKFNIIL